MTIVHTAQLLEEFYPDHVIKRRKLGDGDFWENEDLEYQDWRGIF